MAVSRVVRFISDKLSFGLMDKQSQVTDSSLAHNNGGCHTQRRALC